MIFYQSYRFVIGRKFNKTYLSLKSIFSIFILATSVDISRTLQARNMSKINFTISDSYDYTKSSEENYQYICEGDSPAPIVGKYKSQREALDYNYHLHYTAERQELHDQLIDAFHKTRVYDAEKGLVCEAPLENWIVFTAGPMGAGKGHTIQWLYKEGLFPLDAFVNVDPDAIRALLPETSTYNKIDDSKTGFLTQKEVGYISEVLTFHALEKGKNVLVDGSLRDAPWYLEYFVHLRERFPILKIAIFNVSAQIDTVLQRARRRAKVTGRIVPDHVILDAMAKIPKSLDILTPKAEFYAHINNEDNDVPKLEFCEMKQKTSLEPLWKLSHIDNSYLFESIEASTQSVTSSWQELFSDVWTMHCALPVTLSARSTPRSPNDRRQLAAINSIEDGSKKEEKSCTDAFSSKVDSSARVCPTSDTNIDC